MPWKAIDSKEQIPNIKKGDLLEIDSVSFFFFKKSKNLSLNNSLFKLDENK